MSQTTHLTKRQVISALTQYMEGQLGYGQGRVQIEGFSFPQDKPDLIAIVYSERETPDQQPAELVIPKHLCSREQFERAQKIAHLAVEQLSASDPPTGVWGECHCSCHNSPPGMVDHFMACCTPCRECGLNVSGDFSAHVRDMHKMLT